MRRFLAYWDFWWTPYDFSLPAIEASKKRKILGQEIILSDSEEQKYFFLPDDNEDFSDRIEVISQITYELKDTFKDAVRNPKILDKAEKELIKKLKKHNITYLRKEPNA
jgi:hypothetical protein